MEVEFQIVSADDARLRDLSNRAAAVPAKEQRICCDMM
jgi:hypothetical protein